MILHEVDVFWSVQSPYCYYALDRMLAFDARSDGVIHLKPIRPGVLRLPDSFRGRSALEMAYFDIDAERTAAFLGLPVGAPRPSPVDFRRGEWVAKEVQPRIDRLHHLLMAAISRGKGMAFLDCLTRLIWDGSVNGWDQGEHIEDALVRAGLDPGQVVSQAARDASNFDDQIEINEREMYAAGHWGAPLFVYRGEPFYGQDRWDQLLWRIEENT